jgi:hypothetical protein
LKHEHNYDLFVTYTDDPAIAGVGRANTPTAGWEYDYNCITGSVWPNGVDQVPSILGTVIRAKPHNGSPAGVVASFIGVRQE